MEKLNHLKLVYAIVDEWQFYLDIFGSFSGTMDNVRIVLQGKLFL